MTIEKPFDPAPPFVWADPRVQKGELTHQAATLFDPLAADARLLFGVVHEVDRSGVGWLARAFASAPELRGDILVALSAAGPTGEEELRELLALQGEVAPRLEVRVRPLGFGEGRPTSAVCLLTPREADGVLFVGPSANFNDLRVGGAERPAAADFVWRCDGALRESFCEWFDWAWLNAAPLTEETAAVPRLVPARGTPEAAEMWAAYLDACRAGAAPSQVGEEPSAEAAEPEGGSARAAAETSVTKAMGVPRLDEVGERVARALSLGSQVTIDKSTRIPPLDAPMRPEWFGVDSLRQIGAVSRKVQYRVSVINEKTLKELDNKRKMARTLLDRLSFPLGEGVRWMPEAAFPLFEGEMGRVNKEGQALLKAALGDDADAFIESQRGRIYSDADAMYKDFKPGSSLPEENFGMILDDLKDRLKKAGGGTFLPKVSRLAVSFKVGNGSQWESVWGQAWALVQAVAEFPRKALTDSFFMRGLRVDRDQLLAAMDVFGDALVARHKTQNVERQAREDLALVGQIEAADVGARAKCAAALSLLDGAGADAVSRLLEEEKRKEERAAAAAAGAAGEAAPPQSPKV